MSLHYDLPDIPDKRGSPYQEIDVSSASMTSERGNVIVTYDRLNRRMIAGD